MRALIAADAQLFRLKDGSVWTPTIYGYGFWKRYLQVFDSIVVAARMMDIDDPDLVKKYLRSDGESVEFAALPFARGAKQYILQWNQFLRSADQASEHVQCAVIRLPSISASFVEHYVHKKGIPYALEVVVDPQNAYPKGMVRAALTKHLQMTVSRANGVSYVTQYALQKDYPSYALLHGEDSRHFSSYYSTIVLNKSYFSMPRDYTHHAGQYQLIHVANNMNNDIKGHDVVLQVITILAKKGLDVSVSFVGDGKRRSELEQLALSLGVRDKVEFVGLLSSAEMVRQKLVESDIFIFPTKAEGLPRVVIEAMAVGLPCLSTPVNGIPELLEEEYMFDPVDAHGFANKVVELISNPAKMNEVSARNIEKAKEYEESILCNRRNDFYGRLKKLAERN